MRRLWDSEALRVGIAFQSRSVDLKAMLSQATLADELGYDSLWATETWTYDVFLVLHKIAEATRRVKLGTGVANVYSRSPAALAMAYATLNEFSEGRAILGLGTSGQAAIEQWHGGKYEKPLRRVRECVAVIRQVLSGQPLNHDGEIFNVKHFRLGFKPSHPTYRIYLAALGLKMSRLAAEIADGVLLFFHPFQYLPVVLSEIEQGLKAAGRRRDDFDIAYMLPVAVNDNVEKARDSMRKLVGFYVGAMGVYYHRLMSRAGFSVEADRIKSAWLRGDKADMYQSVTDEMVHALAAVGTVDDCRRVLRRLEATGVNLAILELSPMAASPINSTTSALQALAPTHEPAST